MSPAQRSAPGDLDVVGRVLVVDDHPDARQSMAEVLRRARHQVDAAASAAEALRLLAEESYDVVVADLRMPGMTGLDLLRELETRPHGAQVVVVTAHASIATAVEAMRRGAFDYVEKPFSADQLESLVRRALAHGQCVDQKRIQSVPSGSQCVMLGDSPPMRALRTRIEQAAATSETVLIYGESGTGKELIARHIHAASPRAGAPLVSLNCPVLSAHLMESELFGHERGAFTGADAPRTGRFELADGGTILLDEVTEIDLALQAKLLRVLQERSFERVGSSVTLRVDVRVLATTNRDLAAEVEAGRFRRDLYYRLAVVPLWAPPLRERREDVPRLADHFLARAAARIGRTPPSLSPCARQLLVDYDWPGNVRELENVMTRATVLGPAGQVSADDLRPWLIGGPGRAGGSGGGAGGERPLSGVGMNLCEMERQLIEATLARFNGHRAKTAAALGIGIRTLSGKLRAYGYAPRAKAPARAA